MNNLNSVVNQKLFEDITMHLLNDHIPSAYFNQGSLEQIFMEYPFNLLLKLKSTQQSLKYHPEGNVWNHTMLVVDEAAKVKEQCSDEKAFMWAALLHDIGKPATTRNRKGKITAYDHDKVGAVLSGEFLHALTKEEEFINKVCALVRWHMQLLYVVKDLPYQDKVAMLKEVNLQDIALLGWCDRMGRKYANPVEEEKNIYLFQEKFKNLAKEK